MNLTQYLIFELSTECNLGEKHPKCPNRHPERYASVQAEQPVSDKQIVDIASAMYNEKGFRGHIGWHYYNEPLMSSRRMWRLMDWIQATVPQATFTLWTNGMLLPVDTSQFSRFGEIHVTQYGGWRTMPNVPQLRQELASTSTAMHVHKHPLDGRLQACDGEEGSLPCNRMFTEFVIDYWGNIHLCCYDWRGEGSVGNVHDTHIGVLLREWQNVRERVSGQLMDSDSPPPCRRCQMRSPSIPRFVPPVRQDAVRHIREVTQ